MKPVKAAAFKRVGMLGGAFDPPHRAHRALAQAALAELELDLLLIVPTGLAGHKSRPLTAAVHRLALCELAFAGLAACQVDDRELHRQGVSYSIDTLSELALQYPGAQLFLIIGSDQLAAFKTWRRWPDVLNLATLVVASRAQPAGAPRPQLPSGVPFIDLHMPPAVLSATEIRAALAGGSGHPAGLTQLVPETVAGYISQHSLYQKPS